MKKRARLSKAAPEPVAADTTDASEKPIKIKPATRSDASVRIEAKSSVRSGACKHVEMHFDVYPAANVSLRFPRNCDVVVHGTPTNVIASDCTLRIEGSCKNVTTSDSCHLYVAGNIEAPDGSSYKVFS